MREKGLVRMKGMQEREAGMKMMEVKRIYKRRDGAKSEKDGMHRLTTHFFGLHTSLLFVNVFMGG